MKKLQRLSQRDGFTLIELLVVISIIAVLASLVLAALANTQRKGRDAQRISDLRQIHAALKQYHDDRGCLPVTSGSSCLPAGVTYNEANPGGWDYSSQGDFLPFLLPDGYLSGKLVDPKNNGIGDVWFSYAGKINDGFAYGYYCYTWHAPGTIIVAGNLEGIPKDGSIYGKIRYGIYFEAFFEEGYNCQ